MTDTKQEIIKDALDGGALYLGDEEDGTPHFLAAKRNLSHTPSMTCGCNPDGANDGVSQWWVNHHEFPDEIH